MADEVTDPFDALLREVARAPSPPPAPWEMLEQQRYRILELLGRGGGGQVYKAYDEKLGRQVALKFLNAAGPDHAAQLLKEARTQARVRHEGVCQVYEVVEGLGRPFIAMQLIDGPTLRSAAPRLTMDEKVSVMRQVAAAVEAAHRLGIVHRDLKPPNIMLEQASDGWHAYVLDFGLAREVDKTLTQGLVGTPQFMAPEQASGDTRAIGACTDVWALGATFYTLLAGRPPFHGESTIDILKQVENDEPPRLAGVPRELEAIVLRCLEKSPAQRYANAAGLARDLAAFERGEPVSARAPGLSRRVLLRARRHRTTIALTVMGCAALALALRRPPSQWRPIVRELEPSYEEYSSRVRVSPDGKWLLYDSDRSSERQLYIQSVDGGPSRTLRRAGNAVARSWSSDGKFVYFSAGGAIQRMPADESAPPLEVLPLSVDAVECAGRLFHIRKDQGIDRLLERAPDGTERELLRTPQQLEQLSCSPDGHRVAYCRRYNQVLIGWLDTRDLVEHLLPESGDYPAHPVFHPDGRSLVHTVRDGARSTMWEYPFDGSHARQLTDGGYDRWPALSPDGRRLFFNLDDQTVVFSVRALDGTPQRRFSSAGAWGGLEATPDGREIISSRMTAGTSNRFEIVALSLVDGSERVLVPRGFEPVLSPDGKEIYFLDGLANQLVWVQPLSGGPARVLVHLPAEAARLHAGPDALHVMLGGEIRHGWRQPYDGSLGDFEGGPGVQLVMPAADGWRVVLGDGQAAVVVPPGPWPAILPPATRFIWPHLTFDRRAFVGSANDSEIWLYTLATGETRRLARVSATPGAALSRDGQQLYTITVQHHTRRMELTNYAELPRP